jgi:hypothetical protein
MRFRSLVLVLLGIVAAATIALLRWRTPSEYVGVHFDDDSTIRLTRGLEARDLLDDAHAVLDAVA